VDPRPIPEVLCQHGFRAKRSCETQLLTLSHELLSNLHSSIQTDLIILDLNRCWVYMCHGNRCWVYMGHGNRWWVYMGHGNRWWVYIITMLYKITNNLIAVDTKLYLTTQPYLSTRNNNPLQYQIISTRTNYYKYSFSPHAVVLWNALSYTVVNNWSKVRTSKHLSWPVNACKCVKFLHLFLLIFDFTYSHAIFVVNFYLILFF
jgi:hypothetical protein